jgi:hypothetical protein
MKTTVNDAQCVRSDANSRYVQCLQITSALLAVAALTIGTVAIAVKADADNQHKVFDSVSQE